MRPIVILSAFCLLTAVLSCSSPEASNGSNLHTRSQSLEAPTCAGCGHISANLLGSCMLCEDCARKNGCNMGWGRTLAGGCKTRVGRLSVIKPAVEYQGRDFATGVAVMAGLRWLARHQSPEGNWDADGIKKLCKYTICEGPGSGEYDVGVTGLALLAFTGAGYTHASDEEFEWHGAKYRFHDVVKNAAKWLIKNQDADGCIGPRTGKFMYNHAVATQALCELYRLTKGELLKEPAQKAADFLLAAQNPWKGWRYEIKPGDNDTSVTGWAVYALASAAMAGLSVDKSGFAGAVAWLDEVTDDMYYRVGYNARDTGKVVVPGKNEDWAHHEAMAAIGMACRMMIRKDKTDPRMKGGMELLLQDLPSWDNSKADDKKVDFYYWFQGTLAISLCDGPNGKFWKGWAETLKAALIPNQKTGKDGCAEGSWDTVDVDRWGFEGGRVYGTAINLLTLERCYGHDALPLLSEAELASLENAMEEIWKKEAEKQRKEIEELVRQLGDENMDIRDEAAAKLVEKGRPIVSTLWDSLRATHDTDIRNRIYAVLKKIE